MTLEQAVSQSDAELQGKKRWVLSTGRGWIELEESSTGKIHVSVWRSNHKQDDLITDLAYIEIFNDAEEAVEWCLLEAKVNEQ